MERERAFVPLTSLENHLPIKVGTYPPYRQQLLIDQEGLSAALAVSGASNDRFTWYFVRNEPEVTVAPQHPGEVSEVTAKPLTAKSEGRRWESVVIDPASGQISIRIPYTDAQTQTPKKTAHHCSSELGRALGRLPGKKYQHAWRKDDRPTYEVA